MLTYGIIGTSFITDEFIKGAQEVIGDFRLTSVYSRTEERGMEFARKYGAEYVYTKPEDLAKSEVDAVYIASPNSLHYEHSRLMLENGKHVICEKPVVVYPEQLSELISLAEKNDLVYMEAIMYQCMQSRQAVVDAMKTIGEITSVHFDFSQLSSRYEAFKNGENPNIFNPEFCAGCFMDLGVYCVYPMIDFFGIPKNIISSSVFVSNGADVSGASICDYENMQVILTYSKIGQSGYGSQIIGTEGAITIESISQFKNINVIYKDKGKKTLMGDMKKETIMGLEAKRFYEFINERDRFRDEMHSGLSLAFSVSKTMSEIREKCRIKFK